jgi:hypothetical protein
MQVQFSPLPDEDTAAAILAAIACCLEPAPLDDSSAALGSVWHTAGTLAAQGLPPARGTSSPKWSAAERVARAARWSSGIVGL